MRCTHKSFSTSADAGLALRLASVGEPRFSDEDLSAGRAPAASVGEPPADFRPLTSSGSPTLRLEGLDVLLGGDGFAPLEL